VKRALQLAAPRAWLSLIAFIALIALIGGGRGAQPAPIDNKKTNAAAHVEDRSDPTEWSLLHAAAGGAREALGVLARYYQDHQAWDEFSAVRSRMLEHVAPGPGPVPGGPFPRIGLPRDHPKAPTVLSRWLNRADLPELFEAAQVSQRDLEAKLRALPPSAANRTRLADVLCSELLFAEAAKLYEQALADHEQAHTRERLHDVRRILTGNRTWISGPGSELSEPRPYGRLASQASPHEAAFYMLLYPTIRQMLRG
jgi:hypothetical protein